MDHRQVMHPATIEDQEHLKLLEIFHYLMAVITALAAFLPIIHLCIGIAFLVLPEMIEVEGEALDSLFPAQPFGLLFTLIPAIMILGGWAMAFVIFLSGRFLRRRKNRTFCFVIAGFLCTSAPLGTVLGCFTIIVLTRPSVRALFEQPLALPHPGGEVYPQASS